MEVRHDFLTAGGKDFNYIACLNENDAWMKAMAEIAELHMIGWPTIMSPTLNEERNQQARISLEQAQRLGAAQ